jgi:hypothetical protein
MSRESYELVYPYCECQELESDLKGIGKVITAGENACERIICLMLRDKYTTFISGTLVDSTGKFPCHCRIFMRVVSVDRKHYCSTAGQPIAAGRWPQFASILPQEQRGFRTNMVLLILYCKLVASANADRMFFTLSVSDKLMVY